MWKSEGDICQDRVYGGVRRRASVVTIPKDTLYRGHAWLFTFLLPMHFEDMHHYNRRLMEKEVQKVPPLQHPCAHVVVEVHSCHDIASTDPNWMG